MLAIGPVVIAAATPSDAIAFQCSAHPSASVFMFASLRSLPRDSLHDQNWQGASSTSRSDVSCFD